MRAGHCASLLLYLRGAGDGACDGKGTVAVAAGDEGVVILEAAVAAEMAFEVSFAAWPVTYVAELQTSRRSVHVRRGAPIVGIAWSHCLLKPGSLRVGPAQCRIQVPWTNRKRGKAKDAAPS